MARHTERSQIDEALQFTERMLEPMAVADTEVKELRFSDIASAQPEKRETRATPIKGRELSELEHSGKAFTVLDARLVPFRHYGHALSLEIFHGSEERTMQVPWTEAKDAEYQALVAATSASSVHGVRLARFKLPGGGTFFALVAAD